MTNDEHELRWSVGLMTGTVLDGNIDVAFLKTDGESVLEFGPWALVRYEDDVRTLLEAALEAGLQWKFDPVDPAVFETAEKALTEAQSHAVLDVAAEVGIDPREIDVIGFHGQTVLHRGPVQGSLGRTRQLADGRRMVELTGAKVVVDMRSDDMELGGQGAPLAAVYHRALLKRLDLIESAAFLNLGGVANVTWAGSDALIAFDTGPANAPINDWVRAGTGDAMDVDGRLAAGGRVDETRLRGLLQHPYLTAPYPKSLDRFDFSSSMADGLDLAEGAATLTAFTAEAVNCGVGLLPARPSKLLVSGGGRKNPTLMGEIASRTGCELVDVDEVGLRGDAIEAEAFAFLSARRLRGLPTSFPSTTGVNRECSGGSVLQPESFDTHN